MPRRSPSHSIIWIYGLADPRTLLVRYVGQSYDPARRLANHLYGARRGTRGHRYEWLRQLLAEGLRPHVVLLRACSAADCDEHECAWIKRLAHNALTNQTDGGPGWAGSRRGASHTPETRAKISAALQGREGVHGFAGRHHTPTTRHRLSEERRDAWRDGRWSNRRPQWTPERRIRHAQAIREAHARGAYR